MRRSDMKSLNLWWSQNPIPGNFGDILSPIILRKLGYNIVRTERSSSRKFMCIGSTVNFIKTDDTVWGTGIMQDSHSIEKNANYLAVRGPLTGEKVGCETYGDPGLLCSHLWRMESGDKKELGIIPHYVDYKQEDTGNHKQINILNSDPIKVIKDIVECDSIISSSLHGIVVAHSYGIPAGWWKPSDKLSGDGSKFRDYAESVGIDLMPSKTYNSVKMTLPDPLKIKEVQKNLLSALSDFTR